MIEVTNGLDFTSTANFEKSVRRVLPKGVESVNLRLVGMRRRSSSSYSYFMSLDVNGVDYMLEANTNHSPAWDEYNSIESGTRAWHNWQKNVSIMLLEENKEYLQDCLKEEFEY